MESKINGFLKISIYTMTTVLGVLSLLYPFIIPTVTKSISAGNARAPETPLLMTLLIGLCLLVLIYEVQGQSMNTKMIALLGILVSINAILRFIEVGIPGPGGFSPIFFLIILTGYLYGARFGFLMGTLTLLVSAILTGGIGPWLPGQMFAAGWVGMSAAILLPLVKRLQGMSSRSDPKLDHRVEIIVLIIFGFLWGLLYGLIMNLWSWPYFSGQSTQFWTQETGLIEIIRRYLSYYLLTSLVWDLSRGFGTAFILLAFGIPTIHALRRFQLRFVFEYLAQNSNHNSAPEYEQTQKGSTLPVRGKL